EAPSGAGMVILPDVRGLHNFYCALARRFAEAGIDALAFDYFGRSAGLTEGRNEDFDWKAYVQQLSFDNIGLDATAAAEHLRSATTATRIFTVGFCLGGAMSWRQSAVLPGLAGAIGFYGGPSRVQDVVDQMKAPLLLLVAGADFTPVEEFQAVSEQLSQAGVPNRM